MDVSEVLYVIYQPIPHRDRVYIWVNGDDKREMVKMSVFTKWIIDSGQETLIPSIQKSYTTYSFYLWNKKNKSAHYLQPNITTNDFKKPILQEVRDVSKKQDRDKQQEENPYLKVLEQFSMVDLADAKKGQKM
jgi:hypothetical protein